MSQAAFLFVDGLPDDVVQELRSQLNIVNRVGGNLGKLTRTWRVSRFRDGANAFCLGETHSCGNIDLLARPVLTSEHGSSEFLIEVSFPLEVMPLIYALQKAEQLMLSAAREKEVKTTPSAALERAIPTPVSKVESHDQQKELSAPTAAVSSQNEQAVAVQKSLSAPRAEAPVGNAPQPFFAQYLQEFPENSAHVLVWDQNKVWLDRPSGRVYTDCANIAALVELFARTDKPCLTDYVDPPDGISSFAYDAFVWSYGLHAPLSECYLKDFGQEGSLFHLKKWPLFGQWETNAKLLLLTTLFTQKPSSVREVAVKSGLDRGQVLHFLAAAAMAQLPIEHEQGGVTEPDCPVVAKKEVGWVNCLREKLHMQDFL